MKEKDLLNEQANYTRTDKFMQQTTRFWRGSRRRAIQLLAAGAGVTATLSLPTFLRGNVAVAAETEAEDMNKQVSRLEPNLFELQGYSTQITYSTTNRAGVPQLNYIGRNQERTFSGEDIQLQESGFGRSVTVLLENGAADAPIESLTLLLPFVQLSSNVKQLPIQTLAIFSTRAAFVDPNNPAQLQNYDTISLSGTAKLV